SVSLYVSRHCLLLPLRAYFIYPAFTCLTPLALFFFFNDTATTEIYTLSLHDALPICFRVPGSPAARTWPSRRNTISSQSCSEIRSEEHTSELQSLTNLVCRLLLEKKKKKQQTTMQRHVHHYDTATRQCADLIGPESHY